MNIVYGSILDTPDFCNNLSLKPEKIQDDQHIIVEGDFNLIIDMNLDSKKKKYKNINNKKVDRKL